MSISIYPPIGSSSSNSTFVQFDGTQVDAFGRLRVGQPYTIFDAQSRFAADTGFSYFTATGGTTAFNNNKSSVNLNVTTTSGSTASAQTFNVFPYQPGKSLLTLQTFTMAAAQTNLVQRIGYFNVNNGVYLEQGPNGVTFVVRTFTSGTVNNSRFVAQADWNGDKLDGTGPSGVTLDLTKTQILWFDFEWLGVGNVRCGFIVNGQYITCHTFQNSNFQTAVYMQTAILPLRYEISTTATTSAAATLQMICASVISEGGYEQTSQIYNARNATAVSVTTSFIPIVSMAINIAGGYNGAVIIPASINFVPTATGTYEVILVKNATLTGATYATSMSGSQVLVDTAATAMTAPSADSIIQVTYATATNQGQSSVIAPTGYNFALALGTSNATTLAGAVSDTYTLAARVTTGTGSGLGAISFYNLTA
jgi:hypothetical protein